MELKLVRRRPRPHCVGVDAVELASRAAATLGSARQLLQGGVALPPEIPLTLINGTDISSHITLLTFNEPGHYEAVIARTGITSEGITTLVRRLLFTVGTAHIPHLHPKWAYVFSRIWSSWPYKLKCHIDKDLGRRFCSERGYSDYRRQRGRGVTATNAFGG
jgi:hypothetical protein